MNSTRTLIIAAFCCGTALAGDTYSSSLSAGDAARAAKKTGEAVTEYELAVGQATTDTERSLAKGKLALVFAFDQKDYEKAKALADEAMATGNPGPIARVTALQALAGCQMHGDEDYEAASETLNTALELQTVEWAQPILANMLGDSYRFSGRFDEALAAYGRVNEMPAANDDMKAIAQLNIGITQQYGMKDPDQARAAYQAALALKPGLKAEVDGHLSRLP